MARTWRIGTRASKMAVRQSEIVMAALQAKHPDDRFELVTRPAGADLDLKSRLGAFGGKGGAFIEGMRAMMRAGEADMAMHSLKDLPGNDDYYENPEFTIGANMPRDDPRDALVLRRAFSGGEPLVIGTSSIRRRAFLRRLFPEASVVPFRGAADRRVERLDAGQPMEFNYGGRTPVIDAVVLAKSGLDRVDLGHRISRTFSIDEMCPAVGQGVVVVECPAAATATRHLLASVNDRDTTYLVEAERAMLRVLNGHCDSPIGGYACLRNGRLTLTAIVLSGDGRSAVSVVDETLSAPPTDLGRRVGERLQKLGAQRLIDESRYAE